MCNQLEGAREQRGLSRQNLADAVGVHYQTIGYIERGEYSPSLELALRMARVLELSVEDLFTLGVPSKPTTSNIKIRRERSPE